MKKNIIFALLLSLLLFSACAPRTTEPLVPEKKDLSPYEGQLASVREDAEKLKELSNTWVELINQMNKGQPVLISELMSIANRYKTLTDELKPKLASLLESSNVDEEELSALLTTIDKQIAAMEAQLAQFPQQ
jgi:uncharacterized phage infection (PIP) family protein YhgE